jgi:hypothetical protein
VFYIRLAFLGKRAIVSGARYAVGVWERASTDALASLDVNGNRLKQLVMINYVGPTTDSPPASFSSHTGPRERGTTGVPLM